MTLELELAGDFSEASGQAAGERLLQMAPRPTAVFAANDSMAVGCLAAIHAAGLEVPRDFSLAGFDDIPIARYLSPPLTSVGFAIEQLGARAMGRVLELLAEPGTTIGRSEIVPTRLVVRASCAALSSTADGIGKVPSTA